MGIKKLSNTNNSQNYVAIPSIEKIAP